MTNEAYRAVFLRIHPTGKMVLSLTTEEDGNGPRYQQLVADALGVPPLDVKVVPADTDRFGEGHGFNTAPSPGVAAAIDRATDKILDKARLLAGASLSVAPDALQWSGGAFLADDDPDRAATIADVAMYSYSSGRLPPGVEGGLDAQAVYRD
jgi:aerobic carbon-monoxide dehydrogenase large subunit